MANELTTHQKELVSLVGSRDLGDIIKPMMKEIHLFDTYIAGTTRIKDESLIAGVKPGDALTLQREDNKFDDHAILILNAEGVKLGYVPEKDNTVFARLMDAGKVLKARVKYNEPEAGIRKIGIGIFLVDL